MAENYLPPEYAAQLQGLQRQRAISQALLQNSLAPHPTEVVSGRAVRQSPWEHLARLLTGGVSSYNLDAADKTEAGVRQEIANAEKQQISGMLAQPGGEGIKLGRASSNPRLQALAETLAKQQIEQAQVGGKFISESGDTKGALAYLTNPTAEPYAPPAREEPTVNSELVNGVPVTYARQVDKYGVPSIKLGASTNVSVNNTNAQRGAAYDSMQPQIKLRQEEADFAKQTLSANRSALEALNEGAKSGAGGEFFQKVRSIGKAVGFDPEGQVPTEKLAMATGQHILANARKLAPVTEQDIEQLKQIIGSLNTNPENLSRMFEIMNASSLKSLQNYNKYIDTASEGFKDEYKQILQAQKVGYDIPGLVGNPTQQVRTAQELQQRGGDISQLKDPSGAAYPADARFDVRGNGLPAVSTPVSSGSGLSLKEQEELNALRKRFGAK